MYSASSSLPILLDISLSLFITQLFHCWKYKEEWCYISASLIFLGENNIVLSLKLRFLLFRWKRNRPLIFKTTFTIVLQHYAILWKELVSFLFTNTTKVKAEHIIKSYLSSCFPIFIMRESSVFHEGTQGLPWNTAENAPTLQQKYSTDSCVSLLTTAIETRWNSYAAPLHPDLSVLWKPPYDGQCLSSVGQWFPTHLDMWQLSACKGPDLHSVPHAESYGGREWLC